MSNRAIRRAAERQTAKLAAKAAKVMTASASAGGTDPQPPNITVDPSDHPISDARLAANRANAQKSTGPSSSEGKATSSKNALKTGLTGRYDFRLQWTPDGVATAATDAPPDLFTAIEEQLGLKLQAAKGPVETLVIDHVEQPTAN